MTLNKNKTKKPGIRLKIYVREDMVGGGKLDLLKLVGEKGSISSAAREMGLDYKRAWFLLDTLQRCFSEPLYITNRGRGSKAGTQLTHFAENLIKKFNDTDKKVKNVTDDFLSWLESHQRN